jgi:hypothetical protein
MCAGRRWEQDVFRQFFVSHPLVQHLARRLVWGVYDGKGKLKSTFRVAEDGTFADRRDDALSLPARTVVGIPHALELEGRVSREWENIFADYELLQPFDQIARPTTAPTTKEKTARTLDRAKGVEIPTGKLRGMESYGWQKGSPQDAGGIYEMVKPIPGGTHEALLSFEPGILAGGQDFDDQQTLGDVVVRKRGTWDQKGRMKLGELDPIVFSELVRDLEKLMATR